MGLRARKVSLCIRLMGRLQASTLLGAKLAVSLSGTMFTQRTHRPYPQGAFIMVRVDAEESAENEHGIAQGDDAQCSAAPG